MRSERLQGIVTRFLLRAFRKNHPIAIHDPSAQIVRRFIGHHRERQGNQTRDEKCADQGAAGRCLASDSWVQNGCQAALHRRRSGHCQRAMTESGSEPIVLGEIQKVLRVFTGAHALLQHRIIAGPLLVSAKTPDSQPCKWIKPVQGLGSLCHEQCCGIAALKMCQLVEQHSPQLGVRPVNGIRRQEKTGTENSPNHRNATCRSDQKTRRGHALLVSQFRQRIL